MSVKKGKIYKITNPKGNVYIGQTRNYKKRMSIYKRLLCKEQPKLYNSLNKYGVNNHIFEIIEECDFENLNKKERYWQDYYNATNNNNLNCLLTDPNTGGHIMSEETKKKISIKNSGINNGMHGHIKTQYMIDAAKKNIEKKVINVKTLEIYDSITKAAKCENYKLTTLSCYLNGDRKNKSDLLFLSEYEPIS